MIAIDFSHEKAARLRGGWGRFTDSGIQPMVAAAEGMGMNELTLKYWANCLHVLMPRRRPKYTKTFKCDCGWRYRWRVDELIDQHKHPKTIICHDCGDVYRTLGGAITAIVPNPLQRSLISDKAIIERSSRQNLLDRYHRAACGFTDYNFR